MAFHRYKLPFAGLAALILSLGPADAANLAEQGFFAPLREKAPQSMKLKMPSSYSCSGPISQVTDVADENWRSTSAVFGTTPGGGEGKQYDPKPLLTTKIKAGNGTCLNGHLSAIVGNGKIYGVSRLAMFQVTLTPANGSPRHMVGTLRDTLRDREPCCGAGSGKRCRHAGGELFPALRNGAA